MTLTDGQWAVLAWAEIAALVSQVLDTHRRP
jgi:hypothetical protein